MHCTASQDRREVVPALEARSASAWVLDALLGCKLVSSCVAPQPQGASQPQGGSQPAGAATCGGRNLGGARNLKGSVHLVSRPILLLLLHYSRYRSQIRPLSLELSDTKVYEP
jgi:hypothetical protein